jgi:hypothetical protein
MGVNALAETPAARAATAQMNDLLCEVFAVRASGQKAS